MHLAGSRSIKCKLQALYLPGLSYRLFRRCLNNLFELPPFRQVQLPITSRDITLRAGAFTRCVLDAQEPGVSKCSLWSSPVESWPHLSSCDSYAFVRVALSWLWSRTAAKLGGTFWNLAAPALASLTLPIPALRCSFSRNAVMTNWLSFGLWHWMLSMTSGARRCLHVLAFSTRSGQGSMASSSFRDA